MTTRSSARNIEKGQEKKANAREAGARKAPARNTKARPKVPNPTPELAIDRQALKKIRLAAVAFSHVEREYFPTDEAYEAEREVEERALDVVKALEKLEIPAKAYPSDQYFLTNLLVDDPNFVLNLVDTLRGKDYLQTSVPGALELAGIPYTGAGMRGLVIGNDRNLLKQLLTAAKIPTPDFQFVQRKGARLEETLGLPLIVKLNESGGSVGIDNRAVKETLEDAQAQVNEMIATYKMPVIVERFIKGPEITAVVFDDGQKKHVFLGQKKFNLLPDGKHAFTSIESYQSADAYTYVPVQDEDLAREIERLAVRAFSVLHNKDYCKFDVRVDEETGTPYFTDCNPNTAFGPNLGLPFTEVIETLYGVKFETVLASLMSKYARQIET
jgi:D-alanine-D-alanine ligase